MRDTGESSQCRGHLVWVDGESELRENGLRVEGLKKAHQCLFPNTPDTNAVPQEGAAEGENWTRKGR